MNLLQAGYCRGPRGQLEILSAGGNNESAYPALYFLPGWWSNARTYAPVLNYFRSLGFPVRSFSWRGTGRSHGSSFWGRGMEHDLEAVLNHFQDDVLILISHSGAIDPVRHALRRKLLPDRITAVVFIAPLARSGALPALFRFLAPDKSGTNLQRWALFLGSNVFGLPWFIRHELCIRRVLLHEGAAAEDVALVRAGVDQCAYGRYFLALLRSTPGCSYANNELSKYGVEHALVIHEEFDRNFSEAQQRDTAKAFGADFLTVRRGSHQWFADRHACSATHRHLLEWWKKKRLVPEHLETETGHHLMSHP